MDASSSSSTTIPGRGELKKCAWCGRLVRANVSENRESGAATQAAVDTVANESGPLESSQYVIDGYPDVESADAHTVTHLAAHMPLQIAKPGSFTTRYGPTLDRMLERASDEEVYRWAEKQEAFTNRVQSLAGLMQRQTIQGNLDGTRTSMDLVCGSISERTTLEEFSDAVESLVELVRFAADRGRTEAAFQIAALTPGDGAKRAVLHELAETYWRARDKLHEARALALSAEVKRRMQASERAPRDTGYVHEYYGLDFYPLLRERLLADGHGDVIARMERTALRENVFGVNPHRVWLVQELTSYANDLVRRKRLPDEQLRLAIRYVYLNRSAFWNPSIKDFVAPFKPLHAWYFGPRQ